MTSTNSFIPVELSSPRSAFSIFFRIGARVAIGGGKGSSLESSDVMTRMPSSTK